MSITLLFIVVQEYIEFNRVRRAKCAGEETQRSFFKLINNAPYGKTIENVGKQTVIHLLNDETKSYRLTEKQHCINFKIITENLFGVELRKVNQFINMPFQMGSLSWSGRSCTCIGRTRLSMIGLARRFGCSTQTLTRKSSTLNATTNTRRFLTCQSFVS